MDYKDRLMRNTYLIVNVVLVENLRVYSSDSVKTNKVAWEIAKIACGFTTSAL